MLGRDETLFDHAPATPANGSHPAEEKSELRRVKCEELAAAVVAIRQAEYGSGSIADLPFQNDEIPLSRAAGGEPIVPRLP